MNKLLYVLIILVLLSCSESSLVNPYVLRDINKTQIVDRKGERWDVTQATSLGFWADKFQYGIGRNAFVPLDDSNLSKDISKVPNNLRVIGVKDGSEAQAYSVRKLRNHETANTTINSKPILVGY